MRQNLLLLPAFVLTSCLLAGLAGCSNSGQAVSSTPAPTATLSVTTLNFTSVLAGTTSQAQMITLSNNGNAALTIGASLMPTGTGASAFTESNTCGSSLGAGASCAISVSFSPVGIQVGAMVNYAATITVTTNAAASSQNITLAGTSVAPGATLSTTGLTFTATPGATSAAQSATLTNSGAAPLTITSVVTTGTNAANFTATNACPATLAVGASCSVSVTFSPGASAPLGTVDTAAITFVTNASPATQAINLIGTTSTPQVPTAVLSTTSLTFPPTAPNANSASMTATLFNTGNGVLTISSITPGGVNKASFNVTTGCGSTLAAGASCAISVTFSPGPALSSVAFTAYITLVTNASPSTQTITLNSSSVVASQCPAALPRKALPTTVANYVSSTFSGKVMAGALPMIGSSVQLYAAGNAGNGSAPTALGTAIATDTTGSFSITKSLTCPYNLSTLYVVATGGKAGANGTANSGAVLLSVLGTCASVTTGSSYIVNEATTVAGAYALQQFLVAGGKVGASSTNFLGLQLAAGTAANLVNPATGTSPGAKFTASGTPPSAMINTLANELNACLVATSSTPCTQFYSAVTPSGSAAPTNTLDAVLSLAKNPTLGTGLYTAAQASSAYSPTLTAAPSDWTMFVTYAGGGMNAPSGVGIDSTGNVWVSSYFSAASYFTNTGTAIIPAGITGNNLYESYGLAVDQSDNAWIPDEQTSYAINSGLGAITVLSPSGAALGYGAGGLNFPVSVVIDTGGNNWIVDYGNSHITILDNSGNPVSGAAGYTSSQFAFPVAIAVDANCYGYVANQSASTITRVARDGSSFTSYTTGNGASGVVIDGSNNLWVANYYGNSVGLLDADGYIISSSLSGGGINHPQGVAIDGNGNAWIANYRGPSLTELASASSALPGAALSPAAGFGPDAGLLEAFAIAIDSSGNIWVTNFGNNTITEFVGMAGPVRTPVFGPVTQP